MLSRSKRTTHFVVLNVGTVTNPSATGTPNALITITVSVMLTFCRCLAGIMRYEAFEAKLGPTDFTMCVSSWDRVQQSWRSSRKVDPSPFLLVRLFSPSFTRPASVLHSDTGGGGQSLSLLSSQQQQKMKSKKIGHNQILISALVELRTNSLKSLIDWSHGYNDAIVSLLPVNQIGFHLATAR